MRTRERSLGNPRVQIGGYRIGSDRHSYFGRLKKFRKSFAAVQYIEVASALVTVDSSLEFSHVSILGFRL